MQSFAQKQNSPQQQVESAGPRPVEKVPHRGPDVIRILQRSLGNQAVLRLVQSQAASGTDTGVTARTASTAPHSNQNTTSPRPAPRLPLQAKLTVNTPGDEYEQEADQVAEQVMRIPESQVQRTCACGGSCDDCKKKEGSPMLQMKSVGENSPAQTEAPGSVHEVLRQPGQPLDAETRAFMEPRFGRDFSDVRVHTGAKAAASAEEISARAYTVGRDVVFGAGESAVGSREGRSLVAHELTHTIQQDSGMPANVQRQESGDGDDLYPKGHRYISGASPADRLTGDRLLNWARGAGYSEVVSEATLQKLLVNPGSEEEIVDADIYRLLIQRLSGRDLQSGAEQPNDLEGSDNARERAVIELGEHWDEVRRFLLAHIAKFYEREVAAAIERTPPNAHLEMDPTTILGIRKNLYGGEDERVDEYLGAAATGRWNDIARPGERRGSMYIVGIRNSAVQGEPTIWFYLGGHPLWFYEISGFAFRATDPTTSEVKAQVAEDTKLAGELWPLMFKAGGFGAGMSVSLAAIVAGAALNELGEEGMREQRGEQHRSALEILESAGEDVAVGYILGRVFNGGNAVRKTEQGVAKGTENSLNKSAARSARAADFEERTAKAIRHEVARTEGPEVVAKLRAGRARSLEAGASEKYVAEVDIISEGQPHTYRLKRDGTWCRFSDGICFEADEAPGSEWNEIRLEAERRKMATDEVGSGAPRTMKDVADAPTSRLRQLYKKELEDNPWLEERLDHAETNADLDPHASARERAEISEELKGAREYSRAGLKPDRSKVAQYLKDLRRRGLAAGTRTALIEERAFAKELEKLLPDTTRVDFVAVEETEAGIAQTRVTGAEKEPRIDLPDAVRKKAGLPVPGRGESRIPGSVKPDDIELLGGSSYRFVDHKEVTTLWKDSFYSSEQAVPKIRELLQRDLEIGRALQPNCKGFVFSTDSPELQQLLRTEIGDLPKEARSLLHAP